MKAPWELEKKLETVDDPNRATKGYWRYFYNPGTNESGLDFVQEYVVILSEPVFIGPMPIRKDVEIKYADLDVDRFRIWERVEFKMMGES